MLGGAISSATGNALRTAPSASLAAPLTPAICTRLPCSRVVMPISAAHSARARSAMAWNTGCTSVGDSLITRSTSDVAVWRSSASCVSFINRALRIAICACAAKPCTSAICLSLNGRTVVRTSVNTPMICRLSSNKGTLRLVRIPPSSTLATTTGSPVS